MDTKLSVKGLRGSVGKKELLHGIDLEVPRGSFVGLIGPNGCGKSTLLKTIYRACPASAGAVYLDGRDMQGLSNREMARRMAVVPQENNISFDFTVMELLQIGRFAHRRPFAPRAREDEARCLEALEAVGMGEFRDRSFQSLSGGEKQRVLIAGAFSRGAGLLLLDEPVNHLDIGYQYQIMDIMRRRKETTVFLSVHDLNLALAYCDQVIAMKDGAVRGAGRPEELITPALVEELFGVRAEVRCDESGGRFVRYLGAAGRVEVGERR